MARNNSSNNITKSNSDVQTNNAEDDELFSIEVIKRLYSSALDRNVPISMQGYDIKEESGKTNIVCIVKQICEKLKSIEAYKKYYRSALVILKLQDCELFSLLVEAVLSNLVFDLTVIAQKSGLYNGEYCISKAKYADDNNIKGADRARFNKCLQNDNLRQKVEILNYPEKYNDEDDDEIDEADTRDGFWEIDLSYYIRLISGVYRSTLLITRYDTDDERIAISKCFCDIFDLTFKQVLTLPADKTDNEKAVLNRFNDFLIKTACVETDSDLSSVIKTVISINKSVRKKASKNKDADQSIFYFCELMLMEKLFGFCNLWRIFEVKTPSKNSVRVYSKLMRLGYSSLNDRLIKAMSRLKYEKAVELTESFIYPFCIDAMSVVIRMVIARLTKEDFDLSFVIHDCYDGIKNKVIFEANDDVCEKYSELLKKQGKYQSREKRIFLSSLIGAIRRLPDSSEKPETEFVETWFSKHEDSFQLRGISFDGDEKEFDINNYILYDTFVSDLTYPIVYKTDKKRKLIDFQDLDDGK